MGDGVDLMGRQRDFRVHTGKSDVPPVIFPWPGGIKGFVVNAAQQLPPVDVLPDPFGEFLLNQLLPVLGDGGFLFVENRLLIAILILYIIEHPHIPLVQGLLQNLIGIHPLCAVGGKGLYVARIRILSRDAPLAGGPGAQDFDTASGIDAGAEGFHHKLLVDLHRHPVGTDAHADLGGG
ncbi:unknown [Firmicutes bacterium CAG:137]|nr:unknown [Firmicutes bacterium CAG:137]